MDKVNPGLIVGDGYGKLPRPVHRKVALLVAAGLVVLAGASGATLYVYHHNRTPQPPSEQTVYTQTITNAKDLSNKNQPQKAAQSLQKFAATAQDPMQKAYAQTLSGAIYERDGYYQQAYDAYIVGKDLPAAQGGLAANEGLARVETKLGNKAAAITYWQKCIELTKQLTNDPTQQEDIQNFQGYISALGSQT